MIYMKYILFLLTISLYKSEAQQPAKIDTIYYLVDTVHTPEKDRMLDIYETSNIKIFEIECPCLKYDTKPRFTYRTTNPKQLVTGKKLEDITTVTITTLINLAKGDIGKLHTYPRVVFIEKQDGNYIMHRVELVEPKEHPVIIDSMTVNGK